MPNDNGAAEAVLQHNNIRIQATALLARSPARWAEVQALAQKSPYDTGKIYSELIRHHAELDKIAAGEARDLEDDKKLYYELRTA